MKRSVLMRLNIVLLFFFTAGCQKEIRCSKSEVLKESISRTKQQDLRMWWDSGRVPGTEGVDYGCEGIGGNCLPDAVVTPKTAALLTDFSQSTHPTIFAGIHYSNLSKVISTETLDDVIAGKLNVSMRGKIEIGETGYLKFLSANGTVLSVYPFKK